MAFKAKNNMMRSKRSMKRARDELVEYYNEMDEDFAVPDEPTEADFCRPLRFGYR